MKRMRWLLMGWICLSLGVGAFLWGLPSRSVRGTTRAALTVADRAGVLTTVQLDPTPTPFSNPTATPSSPGGHGRNVFHVFCMPCHGDVGQGLTDEFRLQEYPPEDIDCWKSGCHGARPYENGFTLPKVVPALIGSTTLKRFADGQALYDYMHKFMPYNAPGSLTTDQYLQLTAFLLEQNDLLPAGSPLEVAMLPQIAARPTATPVAVSQPPADNSPLLWIGAALLVILIGVSYGLLRSRSSSASR